MAAGIITTGTFPKLLLPGIRELFGLEYSQLEKVHERVFDKMSSERNFEEVLELGGVGLATTKTEGSMISYDSAKQGVAARFVHTVYGKGMILTREAIEDNMYLSLAQVMTREIAKSLVHAKDTIAANIFNRAQNGSYLLADGVVLCATNHPVTTGGTFKNRPTTNADLSETSLEQAIIDIYDLVGSDGLKIDVTPRQLLIPHNLIFDAHRLLKSELRPNSANNDTNAAKDMGLISEIVPWRRLTDADAWFILTDVRPGRVLYQRRDPQMDSENDFDTQNAKFLGTERYSLGVADTRSVYGVAGA